MLKIRWSFDCLIFNMGMPIPGKMVFILRQGPDWLSLSPYNMINPIQCYLLQRSLFYEKTLHIFSEMITCEWSLQFKTNIFTLITQKNVILYLISFNFTCPAANMTGPAQLVLNTEFLFYLNSLDFTCPGANMSGPDQLVLNTELIQCWLQWKPVPKPLRCPCRGQRFWIPWLSDRWCTALQDACLHSARLLGNHHVFR